MSEEIKYLRHSQIDKTKWDACIRSSVNERIYAYSFYLDYMACNWDALVYKDYEVVMPLPYKKKFGISYLYQPSFTASLGIFGSIILPCVEEEFYKSLPSHFLLGDIYLNSFNRKGSSLRHNYVLTLNNTYFGLFANYRTNTKRNIRKAENSLCYFKPVSPEAAIDLLKFSTKKNLYKQNEIERFRYLYYFLEQRNKAICYGIYKDSKLLSAAIFFIMNERAYFILSANHLNSRGCGSSFMLVDHFIKEYAGSGLVLDFEGSNDKEVAFFYSGFGAKYEMYPALYFNHLPRLIRFLKPSTPPVPFLQTSFQ